MAKMVKSDWDPWKVTTIGLLLVIATALVTGLVVASWNGTSKQQPVTSLRGSMRPVAATPSVSDIDACNQYSKAQTGNTTTETLKDALIGGALGAGAGAAGGAIAGKGGKDVGKGAAVGGLVGATAGTLYGLNEGSKNDARYVEAYRVCMRGRGYTG